MLADTPSPHGSGAPLASVGTFSEGFERSVASPLLPRRLRAMGCAVWSILHAKQSFLAALQVAACDGTHGLINFLLVRQSFQQLSGRSLVCPLHGQAKQTGRLSRLQARLSSGF